MTTITQPRAEAPGVPLARLRSIPLDRLAFVGVVGLAAILYVLLDAFF